MFNRLQIGAGAVLGAFLIVGPAILYGKALGRSEVELAAAKNALTRINQLEKNNAGFTKLTARDRCLVFMRDSGLPIENCD